MKRLLIELTDNEYEKLLKIKGHKTWREVILSLIPKSKEELLINEINKFAKKMQKEDTDNFYVYELIRVALIMLIKSNFEVSIKMLGKCIEVLRAKSRK